MKHAIFDLGNVLINYDLKAFYSRIQVACDQPLEKIVDLYNSEVLEGLETGILQIEHFCKIFRFELDLKWSPSDWAENYGACYSVNDKGLELAEKARTNGATVSILSNLAIFHKLGVDGRFPGFLDKFDHTFFSYELGVAKPNVGIYEKVCDQLKTIAQDCLFLDDKPENIEAANVFGMKGIVFEEKNFEKIEEALG